LFQTQFTDSPNFLETYYFGNFFKRITHKHEHPKFRIGQGIVVLSSTIWLAAIQLQISAPFVQCKDATL